MYCDHIAIDGSSLSTFSHTKGEYMQTIVALEPGQHKLEGIFRSTEAGVTGNKNLVSEKLSIDIDLEAGHVLFCSYVFFIPQKIETSIIRDRPERLLQKCLFLLLRAATRLRPMSLCMKSNKSS